MSTLENDTDSIVSDPDSVYSDSNLPSADEGDDPEQMTYDQLCAIMDSWGEAEVDLFFLVKKWVEADDENRKKYLDDLMGRIRFCLMTPGELEQIQSTKMYTGSSSTCHLLVDKAVAYHKLPINMKILQDSEQSTVRGKPAPTAFLNITEDKKGSPCLYTLDKEMEWKSAKIQPPVIYSRIVDSVVVNNFLIAASGDDEGQDFYVFDPRTLEFSQLASCGMCIMDSSLIYHQGCLYVIGGSDLAHEGSVNGTVLKYEFQTNKWNHFIELPKLERYNVVCVFHDCIYVTDGHKVQCLDLSTQTWESKASMESCSSPLMCVMKVYGEEHLCVIEETFEPQYYNQSTNQWLRLKCSFSGVPPFDADKYNTIAHGNTILFYDDPKCGKWDDEVKKCVQFSYPDDGDKVTVTELEEHFYPYRSYKCSDADVVTTITVPAYKVDAPDDESAEDSESEEIDDSDDSNYGLYEYTYGW